MQHSWQDNREIRHFDESATNLLWYRKPPSVVDPDPEFLSWHVNWWFILGVLLADILFVFAIYGLAKFAFMV